MIKRARIYIHGLVQGVGFRPFIYRIANKYGLKGQVSNLGDASVEVILEGEISNIENFINDLKINKPDIAKIDNIEIIWEDAKNNFKEFIIAKSDVKKLSLTSVIPVDLGICDFCITDIYNHTRWHLYPFTCCAHCGPRFTILYRLPYDRENTSMIDFPFCQMCKSEFENPFDRRYDAQGITCPICGPKVYLINNSGEVIDGDPLKLAAEFLKEGKIIAIKGIGGFHIAVDATNEDAVMELRKRRKRPNKPFAIMSKSLNDIKKYAIISKEEEELLKSPYKPIVLLKKSPNYCLAESIAPGLDSVGVMLPYTGIHLLLLDYFGKEALVMTSGNYPGKPIVIDNNQALKELKDIVDFFLMHNRTIVNRCDDSVIKFVEGMPTFLRRSRGYAPTYITIPWHSKDIIVSFGGELNTTASLLIKNRIITTQHIGDINDLETFDYLINSLNFLLKIYDVNYSKIAHDLNPVFLTTRYARDLANNKNLKSIPVQHHHAHMAALMAEYSIPQDGEIVCIVIDGFGYGIDGMAWGGEILVGGYSRFERIAHLKYQPMPGGDLCTYYPARFLAAILSTFMNDSEILDLFEKKYAKYLPHGIEELNILLKQVKRRNILFSSSLGRLLDAIAVLLDVCYYRTYEGEPPMKLESLANQGKQVNINLRLPIRKEGKEYIIDSSELIQSIIENIGKYRISDLAYEIHKIIGLTFGRLAYEISECFNCNIIGISGGASVNSIILKYIKEEIIKNKKQFLQHKILPPGDGCISTGQCIVASLCD
ncbi:MAG: carbamoyltransferase HypF [Candidatus Methanomethylicaceae archaeon]